jgi:hypothetical protein
LSAGRTLGEPTSLPIRKADEQQLVPADWPQPSAEFVAKLLQRLEVQPDAKAAEPRPREHAILDSLPSPLKSLAVLLTRSGQPTPDGAASGTPTPISQVSSASSSQEPASASSDQRPVPGVLDGMALNGYEAALLALALRSHGTTNAAPGQKLNLDEHLTDIAAFCHSGAKLEPPAWSLLKRLADSGAAGWAIVEKAAHSHSMNASSSQGGGTDLDGRLDKLRTMLQAARALDPEGKKTLAEIKNLAADIVNAADPQDPKRLAAQAMVALQGPLEVQQDVAIRAVRNGLGVGGAGSAFAFANARLAKAATWSNGGPQFSGWLAGVRTAVGRVFHKNPLGEETLSSGKAVLGRIDPALVSMRATRESADRLSAIFGRLLDLEPPGPGHQTNDPAPALTKFIEDSSYHHAVYGHWAKRPVVAQQVMRTLSDQQKEGIQESISNSKVGEELKVRLCGKANDLSELNPETLLKTGWDLVAALRGAIERYAADQDANSRDAQVVDKLAAIPSTKEGQPLDGSNPKKAERTLQRLEDALLGIRSEHSPGIDAHPQAQRARERQATDRKLNAQASDRPLLQLAASVERFEVGSSLTLTNGGAVGVSLPLSAVNFAIGGAFGVAGEIRAKTGKTAVCSMSLTATGGEIVFGTTRQNLARAKLGAVVGFGSDHWPVGVVGTVGYTFEGSGTRAVVIRIPRTGKAKGTGHGEGKPGIEGDRIVADRMAQVLRHVDGLARQGSTGAMVEALLQEFPDVQITTVRDPWHRPPDVTHKGSVDIGVGFGHAQSDPSDASNRDTRHAFSILGGTLAVEASRRSTETREDGPFKVEQLGKLTALKLTAGAQMVGALPGSQSHLASAQMQVHNRFAGRIVKLAMDDGKPNENSVLLEQAPSPISPHGKALLHKRIWELAAFQLDLNNKDVLAKLVDGRENKEAHIAQLLQNKAYTLTQAIEAWPVTNDSSFLILSKPTPEICSEIAQLSAIKQLAKNDRATAKVFDAAEKARRQVLLDDTSFEAKFAIRPTEQTTERSAGTPVLVVEKLRAARATGAGHII